jgi:hypothetical protein
MHHGLTQIRRCTRLFIIVIGFFPPLSLFLFPGTGDGAEQLKRPAHASQGKGLQFAIRVAALGAGGPVAPPLLQARLAPEEGRAAGAHDRVANWA